MNKIELEILKELEEVKDALFCEDFVVRTVTKRGHFYLYQKTLGKRIYCSFENNKMVIDVTVDNETYYISGQTSLSYKENKKHYLFYAVHMLHDALLEIPEQYF